MTYPTTALVFLGGLDLMLISGSGRIVGLSLVFVLIGGLVARLPIDVFFVFFCQRAMIFRAPGINFPNVERWLQVSLYFYITCLLHHFFLRI